MHHPFPPFSWTRYSHTDVPCAGRFCERRDAVPSEVYIVLPLKRVGVTVVRDLLGPRGAAEHTALCISAARSDVATWGFMCRCFPTVKVLLMCGCCRRKEKRCNRDRRFRVYRASLRLGGASGCKCKVILFTIATVDLLYRKNRGFVEWGLQESLSSRRRVYFWKALEPDTIANRLVARPIGRLAAALRL